MSANNWVTPLERFNENMRLAYYLNNRFCRARKLHRSDYVSIALAGLWFACVNFKGDGRFSSYAWPCIEGSLKAYRQREHGRCRKEFNGLSGQFFESIVGVWQDSLLIKDEARQRHEDIEKALKCVTKRRASAIKERYIDGKTLEATGQSLGVSKQRARQLSYGSLMKLRNSPEAMKLLTKWSEPQEEPKRPTATRSQFEDTSPWVENGVRAWEDGEE